MAVNRIRDSQTANVGFDSWHVRDAGRNVDVECDNNITFAWDSTQISTETVLAENQTQATCQYSGSHENNAAEFKNPSDVENSEQLIPTRLKNPIRSATGCLDESENGGDSLHTKCFMKENAFEKNLNNEKSGLVIVSSNGNSEKPFVMPSIKDRIAALKCAAHMDELDLTPVRDTEKIEVIKGPAEISDNQDFGNTDYVLLSDKNESSIAEQDKLPKEPESEGSDVEKGNSIEDALKSLDSAQSAIGNILCQLSSERDSDIISNNTYDTVWISVKQTDLESDYNALDLQAEEKKDTVLSVEDKGEINASFHTINDFVTARKVKEEACFPAQAEEDIVAPHEDSVSVKMCPSPFGIKRCSSSFSEKKRNLCETELCSFEKTKDSEEVFDGNKLEKPNFEPEKHSTREKGRSQSPEKNLVVSEINHISEQENDTINHLGTNLLTEVVSKNDSLEESVAFEILISNEPKTHLLKPQLSSDSKKCVIASGGQFNKNLSELKYSLREESVSPIAVSKQSKQTKKMPESDTSDDSLENQTPVHCLKPKLSSDSSKFFIHCEANSSNKEEKHLELETVFSQESQQQSKSISFDIGFGNQSSKRRLKQSLDSTVKNEEREQAPIYDEQNFATHGISICRTQSDSFLENDSNKKPNRGTYDLDSVSNSLQMASDKGLPVIDALNSIVSTLEIVQDNTSSSVKDSNSSRGTYSLDSVETPLQVSSDKGIEVTDCLRNLADMEELKCRPPIVRLSQSGECDISESGADPNYNIAETNLCKQNRGTYDLDSVSDLPEDGNRKGLTNVDVLFDLAKKHEINTDSLSATGSHTTESRTTLSNENKKLLSVPSQSHESTIKRTTYTLDDVEQSLQIATEKGIPFIDALEKISTDKTKDTSLSKVGNRGTFTLDEVSESLEEAERKGLPVVQVLNSLCIDDQPRKANSLEGTENRSTYTLDEVAQTLETAKEKGLPVVVALELVSNDPQSVSLRDNSAKLRRLENLKNRKTYALASPLETVSEGQKLRLFDGTERRSLPPASPPPIPKPPRPSLGRRLSAPPAKAAPKQNIVKKGLPVLQKLDFLTSACEVMLESSAKTVERNRLSTAGDRDSNYRSVAQERARRRVLKRMASSPQLGEVKSDQKRKSELTENTTKDTNRSTYSFEDVAMSIEAAQTAGLPIVDSLDQLSSEHSVEKLDVGKISDSSFSGEQVTKEKTAVPTTFGKQYLTNQYPVGSNFHDPPMRNRSYSLDDVAFALETSQEVGVPFTRILSEISVEQPNKEENNHYLEPNQSVLTVTPMPDSSKRGTYSLEEVSKKLDETSKELPIIEALEGIAVDARREIRKSLNILDDSDTVPTIEIPNAESGNRGTVTLDSVGTSIDVAKARGLPVIEALEELIKAVDNVRRQSRLSVDVSDLQNQSLGVEMEKESKVEQAIDIEDNDTAVSAVTSSDGYLDTDHSQVKRGTYSLGEVSGALDQAQDFGLSVESALKHISSKARGQRGTYDLDEVGVSLDTAKDKGLPVIAALDNILQAVEDEKEKINRFSCMNEGTNVESIDPSSIGRYENETTLNTNTTPTQEDEKPKPPPRRAKPFLCQKSKVAMDPNSFYIELFPGTEPKPSILYVANEHSTQETQCTPGLEAEDKASVINKVLQSSKMSGPRLSMQTDLTKSSSCSKDTVTKPSSPEEKKRMPDVEHRTPDSESSFDPTGDREQCLSSPRTRATWRPSATVLDKISNLLDTADDFGLSLTDVLDHVADISEKKGEIVKSDVEEESKVTNSQLALLHMQLEEKRRHIEAEKLRKQAQQEEEWRQMRQTAFLYVVGKGRAERQSNVPQTRKETHQGVSEEVIVGSGDEVNIKDQPTPPIDHSSPKVSPRDHMQQDTVPGYETREYRLSEFPPQGHSSMNNQGSFSVGAEVPGNLRPKRERTPSPSANQVPPVDHGTPQRKCWTVTSSASPTPKPFALPQSSEVDREKDLEFEPPVTEVSGNEIEVEEASPKKGGLALFIGDDASTSKQGLTPEQQKKRERFMQSRLKKQQEERVKKELELEKKRRREEKQREIELQKKQEEERRRWEERERQKLGRERMERAQTQKLTPEAGHAAGFSTYRAKPGAKARAFPDRVEPESNLQHTEDVVYAPYARTQTGFSEFSGPQCYVKPSGKSNRKLMINAVSYVCLCGAPNKEAKEKCLQVINECPVQNFIALFRDGLKFRGLYSYIPDADQITKIYGIGPRVITDKMIDNVFKYNSGSKEFVKIPSTKTLSIQVDGISIHKSYWQTNKPTVQSKTISNLRRPPPRTQR